MSGGGWAAAAGALVLVPPAPTFRDKGRVATIDFVFGPASVAARSQLALTHRPELSDHAAMLVIPNKTQQAHH